MNPERTAYLFVGVLLAIVLFSAAATPVAGAPTAELVQTTNETTSNATTANDSTVNTTVGNLTTWVGSMDRFANLTSSSAVRDAIHDGRLQRNDTVAPNGTLVIEVPSARLVSALTAANGTDSDAKALLGLVNSSGAYDFRMRQTEDTTTTMVSEQLLNLSATLDADGLRVVPHGPNGTLYLVLRLDRAVLDRGFPSDDSVDADEAYNVTVTAGNTTSTTEVGIARPPLSFDTDGGVVRLGASRCSLVTGRTYPGADVDLDADVVSPESAPPEAETTVRRTRNGRFAACVNTTDLPSNATLRLSAEGFRGTTRAVLGSGGLVSIRLTDQNATNGTVRVSATLDEPGFVALYRAASPDALTPENDTDICFPPVLDRSAAESRLVGVSDRFGPGANDVPVELTVDLNRSTRLLALVHYDRDDDGRFDYPGADYPDCVSGGDPVSDIAVIRPVESSPSDTEPNATATATPPSNATTAPTTTADGPGFGPAILTLALLATTLLAHRRF